MKKIFVGSLVAIATTTALTFGSVAPTNAAVPAQAHTVVLKAAKKATDKVTISKIKTAKVNKKTKKATVKPIVKASGNVKVTSKQLTVKQGKKTVAKNKNSASLKAGKYSVTSTIKYKTWTNKTSYKNVKTKKLVSDGSKPVKMNCKVADIEPQYFEGFFIDLLHLECTGGFDGVYTARAGYVWDIDDNWPIAGDMIWGESFPQEPKIGSVLGLKFTTTVYPLEKKVYKTTITKKKTTTKIWSKEKTKTLKQSLTVKK